MSHSVTFPLSINVTSGMMAGILAGVRHAYARRNARHAYRRLLDGEDRVLSDIGLSRTDVRAVLMACHGREHRWGVA